MAVNTYAQEPSESYQAMAKKSEGKEFIDEETISEWKKNYEAACRGRQFDDEGCKVTECDLKFNNCRDDHYLFFRGESTARKYPNTSSLVYSLYEKKAKIGTPDLSLKDIRKLLISEIKKIMPIGGVGDGETVILTPKNGSSESYWSYFSYEFNEDDEKEFLIERPKNGIFYWQKNFDGEPMNEFEIFSAFHMSGNYIWFNDPKIGPQIISPVVSYSADPDWAYAFAREVPKNNEGRFFVLSVPKTKLITDCKGTFPDEGEIINTLNCPIVSGLFREEQEVQAFLYPQSKYIYKAYRVKYSDENDPEF